MSEENQEFITLWEAPKITPPTFKLYYDEKGYVRFYTCDNEEGNFIVIDKHTFAAARMDVRVLEGRIVFPSTATVISRLTQDNEGVLCASEDMSIIASESDEIDKQYWKLKTYEC
jgi:hypothetical protein